MKHACAAAVLLTLLTGGAEAEVCNLKSISRSAVADAARRVSRPAAF